MTTDVTGAQNAAAQTASAVSSTASDVSNAATTVDKTVAHQLTITERIFDKVQHFAETKGIDIVMAIIVLVIGYIISREIKVWTRNILKRSNVDPNAIGFITEIVYFICLLFVMTIVFGMLGISTSSLIAALGALVLVTAALAVFLPHRPKTYEGGASVTYTDQDGTYELLVGTFLNSIEDKQPEEKRTLSLSVDETSYLPAMLGVYRNGTPVDPEAFLAKVERCTLEAFPNENGALDIAEPRYNEMFSAAVLETDVVFTGASGTNELVWTLTMKNGDTIRLKHTFEVLPLVHAAFTAEDTPLNTIEDLKALLDRIDKEVPADTVVDIYLPPVTYTGDLHISSRAVNLYGCCDGSGRTVIEGSLTVSTHVPDKVVLHDLDFVGNGGNGLTATASTMIENCSFTGYDIGAAVENGGMIGVEACTFRNNKIGFSYDTLRYSFSKDGFPDCRIEGNDVGIQFVNLPGAMPLDFFGTVFSGNGTDIDNPIQNPIDLSNAIFE